MNSELLVGSCGILLADFRVRPILLEQIKELQSHDPQLNKIFEEIRNEKQEDYRIREDGVLLLKDKICVPKVEELRSQILEEATVQPMPYTYRILRCTRT